jgi:hypothetical protein
MFSFQRFFFECFFILTLLVDGVRPMGFYLIEIKRIFGEKSRPKCLLNSKSNEETTSI